ncbi:hypothetical protein F5Y02DRAFT_85158 [Annulohypoxylon stygium]|nr:hypothetical protein F5Y02DRAFT_85158 [Annulohypoxylon stygium]
MLRSMLKRVSLPARRSPAGTGLPKRRFASYMSGIELPKVPLLRPTIWAITTTAGIYIGCATYNVYRDAQIVKRRGDWKEDELNTYADLEYVKERGSYTHHRPSHSHSAAQKWFPTSQLSAILQGHTDAEILTLCASALNVGLVGASLLATDAIQPFFYHVPAYGPNYTLLTSAFGHSGIFHAAVNTFALLQFAPEVARSHLFEGNGSHFAAFYLSAGIFSALGHHFATILPTRKYRILRLGPTSGASGVITALVGAWATMNPDERIGILFIPGSFHVKDMMTFMVIFETFGLFIGIPGVHIAHATHLSGLAIGWAYAYFDGHKKIWYPTCESAFLWMKRLSII